MRAGDSLQGRYHIERLLGQGGMGGVYLAMHQGLGSRVAIKEMAIGMLDEHTLAGAVRQFRQEAQMLHQLQHANLPRVHDFFEEDGKYYLVMDYVEGSTLEDLIQENPIEEAHLLPWVAELCSVLGYLHSHDPPIIFRDLKPSNIMLDKTGHIKLIDFGIAKNFDVRTGLGTQTSVRGAGTPGFAAPEQYGTGSDARSDIYALGATLFCLLTRTIPPDSTSVASGALDRLSLGAMRLDLRRETVDTIDAMMSVQKSLRPASMAEVARMFALPDLAPGSGALLRPPAPLLETPSVRPGGGTTTVFPAAGPATTAPAPPKPRPWWPRATMAAAVLGLLGWLGFVVLHQRLSIETIPAGATIFLHGTPIGTSRATLTAPMWDTVHPRVELSGYSPTEEPVKVWKQHVHFTLKPLTGNLLISTQSNVPASLAIDAETNGTFQVDKSVTIPIGKHTLHILAQGYQPIDKAVTVIPGDNPQVSFTLVPLPSTVTFFMPSDVTVVFNEMSGKGPSAVFTAGPNVYQFSAFGPGYQPSGGQITLSPGQPTATTLVMLTATPAPTPSPVVAATPVRTATPKPVRTEAPQPTPVSTPRPTPIPRPVDDAHLVDPGKRVGDMWIGAQAAPIINRYHLKLDRRVGHPLGLVYDGDGMHRLIVAGKVISGAFVSGRGAAPFGTRNGVRFGSSRVDVTQAFGAPSDIPDPYRMGSDLVYPDAGVVFIVSDQDTVCGLGVLRPARR